MVSPGMAFVDRSGMKTGPLMNVSGLRILWLSPELLVWKVFGVPLMCTENIFGQHECHPLLSSAAVEKWVGNKSQTET